MDTLTTAERLAQFIDDRAKEVYPEPRTEGHDGITEAMAKEVCKFIAPGAYVLDVGCGQGPAMEWFAKNGFIARGITLGADDVAACQKKGLSVMQRDMHDLAPYWQCDLVWSRHVLEHSIAPFFALHEFHRVLKPGGILYVEVPSPDTACCHESNRNHYSVMGCEMWKNLIVRAGFELLEVREIQLQTGAGPDVYFSIIAKKL